MDKFNQWWTVVKGQFSKIDDYQLIAYGILIAVIYSIAKILFGFEALLKDYFLLDSKTVEYIFSGLLVVLIALDKYQDYRIAQKKKRIV